MDGKVADIGVITLPLYSHVDMPQVGSFFSVNHCINNTIDKV